MSFLSVDPQLDPRRRLLCRAFGVRLVSDIHERACDLGLPMPLGGGRRARIERVAASGLVFIHIPKAAGMSISQALYGEQIKHLSIRLCRRMAGGRLADLPSFAVLREPTERFLSAYRYGRAGGSPSNSVAESFFAQYRDFRSIDDALDHVEQAIGPYAVDHIYRPQSWYVTDAMGRIAVDRLLRMEDIARLPLLVPGFPKRAVPRLNRSAPSDILLTRAQRSRLHRLYEPDYTLWERVVAGVTERRPREVPVPVPAAVGLPAMAPI
jgi:hypothetical protein